MDVLVIEKMAGFVTGRKHVYFCSKIGHFSVGLYGDWFAFGASLKWPFKELQFLHLVLALFFSTQGCHSVSSGNSTSAWKKFLPWVLPWRRCCLTSLWELLMLNATWEAGSGQAWKGTLISSTCFSDEEIIQSFFLWISSLNDWNSTKDKAEKDR